MRANIAVLDAVGEPHAQRRRSAYVAEFALLDAGEEGGEQREHGALCETCSHDKSSVVEVRQGEGLES